MMINPQEAFNMLVPQATHTPGLGDPVKPIPTVIPTPPEWQVASEPGFRTLWVVFAVMLVSSAVSAGLSWNVPVSRRLFHVTTTAITVVAALSYFALAAGQGTAVHCDRATDHHAEVPDTHHLVCRRVYWARYVDWALTTPLLVLNLSLLAGMPGAHTLVAMAANVVMMLSGLFAALGRQRTAQKWGWFAIAIVAYLVVIGHVAVQGSRLVKVKGRRVVRLFSSLSIFSLVLWIVYPVMWGLGAGTHKTSVDTEILVYAVLDILTKVVIGFWLLLTHRSLPETNVELGGYWSHGLAAEGRIRIGEDEEA